MISSCSTIIFGNVIHSKSPTELEIIRNAAVGISSEGTIVFLKDTYDEAELRKLTSEIKTLRANEFLIPGFIDTHTHAPQYYFLGLGTDLPLLEWLETYTFPCEAKFTDPHLARDVFSSVVSRCLKNGTTTNCFFGTIHLPACKILADVVEESGTRGFIGKVNMDQYSPPDYIEDLQKSVISTREFIEYVKGKGLPQRIIPIITPRFALTCTMALMKKLGELASEYSVPIQTHLAENKSECKRVLELFPECKSYTEVYEKAGLLSERTIMAHCIYLSESEIELLNKYKVGIAHCPNSNFCLTSGAMPSKIYLDRGLKVGLGTDVSAGWSPSMLNAIRYAITNSKVTTINGTTDKSLSIAEAFYLATLGSAKVLGMDNVIGNFAVGKQFDAQVISIDHSNIDLYGYETLEEKFAKYLYLGDDRNVKEVYVQGKRIHAAEAVTAPSSPMVLLEKDVVLQAAPTLSPMQFLMPAESVPEEVKEQQL